MPETNQHIFVIIPVYNEKQVIRRVLKQVVDAGYDVVLIDDGSTENIREELKELNKVHYLRHKINLGQGAALQTGIDFALKKNAAFFVTFDADGQHQVDDISKLLVPLQEGKADIVLASRFLENSHHNANRSRVWLLKLARMVNYFFTGIYLSDAHNGLRAMNRTAASSIRITENRMAHATQIIAQIKKHQLRFVEMPATVVYTDYSRGKGQSGLYSLRIFFDLVLQKLFK
ncbi:MAG: glycosyltransferase family 2 protein [Citrobacter freundii]|nr:MAG: glycosyltransferase family 2 protein [Citrobacter freundii]